MDQFGREIYDLAAADLSLRASFSTAIRQRNG
jgi:hypothetical protein